MVDFIIEHHIDIMHNTDFSFISLVLWRLCFDGSIRSNGQSVGVVYISPYGTIFEASCRLEYSYAWLIKAEYALLFGLNLVLAIGSIHIEAFGDSLWVVQQISKGYQCFDESLIVYLGICLDAKFTLSCFKIVHIFRHDNWKELVQQTSGY